MASSLIVSNKESIPLRPSEALGGIWQKFGILPALAVTQVSVILLIGISGVLFTSPATNLIAVSLSALAGIYLLDRICIRDTFCPRMGRILVFAFCARLAIGVVHYLWLINPQYFIDSHHVNYLWDYEWLNDQMVYVRDYWMANGLFTALPPFFFLENKNAFLTMYDATLYYFGGVNVLSFAVWNSLHSIYTACIVGAIALRCGTSKRLSAIAMAIAAFQPFGFISSIFWRDSSGQTWVALALYLLILAEDSTLLSLLALPISCFLAFWQRQPYVLAVMAASIAVNARHARQSKTRMTLLIALIAGMLALAVAVAQNDSLIADTSQHAEDNLQQADRTVGSVSNIPVRVLKGLVGPFPWYNSFTQPNLEYAPVDYVQQVLNNVVYILILPVIPMLFRKRSALTAYIPTVMYGAVLFTLGVVAPGIHSGYVSFGTIFFLPLAVRRSEKAWKSYLVAVFIFFIAANAIYGALGLTGSNLGGSAY